MLCTMPLLAKMEQEKLLPSSLDQHRRECVGTPALIAWRSRAIALGKVLRPRILGISRSDGAKSYAGPIPALWSLLCEHPLLLPAISPTLY